MISFINIVEDQPLPDHPLLSKLFSISYMILGTLAIERNRIISEIDAIKQKLEKPELIKAEALEFIKCDDPDAYKQNTVGFAMPFNTVDKRGRIDDNDLSFK